MPSYAGPAMAISGTPVVDNKGQFNYTIPIAVPPGTAGMVPHLALTYSSTNGDGYEGYGWTISGLDKMTRCPKGENVYGSHGGVNNDVHDAWCFNGSPLLVTTNGLYGAGTTYDTQAASFLKIIANGTVGDGPSWFEVHLKNGTVLQLGNSTDSKIIATGSLHGSVREWLVNRITDVHGNYLTVTYQNDTANGQAYPLQIDYTGTTGTSPLPYNSVHFVYPMSDRPDITPTYQGGSQRRITKLLSDITTYNGSSPVLDYQLAYRNVTSTPGLHSRLTSITLCDGAGGNCLVPMTFGWQGGTGLGTLSTITPSVTPAFTGDFDGDGLLDVMVSGCPTGGAVYLGTATTGSFNNAGMLANYAYWVGSSPFTYSGSACFSHMDAIGAADINGDGFTDVVANQYDASSHLFFSSLQNSPTTPRTFTQVTISGTGLDTSVKPFNVIGDLDGDGLSDNFSQTSASSGTPYIDQGIVSGYGYFYNPLGHDIAGTGSTYVLTAGDYNGDGCLDLLPQGGQIHYLDALFCQPAGTPGTTIAACNSGTLIPGDFNGDGNTDILAVTGSGATLCLSDGLKLPTATSIGSSSSWSSYKIVAGDFDGDGRTDIALIGQSSGVNHKIYLSTGTGFSSAGTITNGASGAVNGIAADANNDGADDLWLTSPSSSLTTSVFQPELMTSVSNGLGATVTVGYDRLNNTATSFYTKGSGGYAGGDTVLYDINGPYYVATKLAFSNGTGTPYTNYHLDYSYVWAIGFISDPPIPGPKSNILTSKFQMFHQVVSVDSRSGLITTKGYNTSVNLIGFENAEVTVPALGAPAISDDSYIYNAVLGRGVSTAIAVGTETVRHHDLDGTGFPGHTTNYTRDAYTNVTQSITTGGDITLTTTNTVTNDSTGWILNKVSESDVESKLTVAGVVTSDITRHTQLSPNALGFNTQTITEPSNATLSLETDFHYDGFGNKDQTTQVGLNVATRTEHVDYDATHGEFPQTNTNALGHVSTATFDPRFGLVTSVTDSNLVTTTTAYDPMGRVISIVKPDGNTITYSYAYCTTVVGGTATCPTTGAGAYVVNASPTNTTTGLQNGANTASYYDAFDRLIATDTQGLGGDAIRTSSVYDGNGLLWQTSRPYFLVGGTPQWTTFVHDALFRVTQVTNPDGSQTSYCFHGPTTSTTNDKGQTKTVVLNDQGLVASVTDGQHGTVSGGCVALGGITTTYTYDAFGDVLTVTVDGVSTITNVYDNLGRKTESTDPDMGHWTYSYDQLAELTGQTDAKSQSTTITYDKLQRPLLRTEAGSTYSKWLWDTTNGKGKLMNACTGDATSCLASSVNTQQKPTYDTLSRVATGKLILDTTTYTYTTHYDGDGHMDSLTYPSGFKADYVYNTYGYLTKIKDDATGNIIWRAALADAELHLTQQVAGGSITTTDAYDPQTGRLLSTCATTNGGTCDGNVANLSYAWDSIGNLSARADIYQGWTERFCYDAQNRLTNSSFAALCNGGGAKTFVYDDLGNLTQKSDVCNTANCFVYGGTAGPHALTSIVGTYNGVTSPTFTYDANGNMTGGGGRTITYTPFNMASAVTDGSIAMGLDYRADRMRYKMCVPNCTSPTTTTYYLYDPATGGMSEKLVVGGSTTWTDYVDAPGAGLVAVRTKTGATSSWRYIVDDNLGSVSSVTDGVGSTPTVERDSYDPWGKRRNADGTDNPTCAITSQTTRGYTGHEMIDSQCLINMNARIYDPALGRFQSADSAVADATNTQSYNRYSYVNNNPLNATDPSGHKICQTVRKITLCWQDPGGGPPCYGCSGQGWDYNTGGFVEDTATNNTYPIVHPDGTISTVKMSKAARMWIDAVTKSGAASKASREGTYTETIEGTPDGSPPGWVVTAPLSQNHAAGASTAFIYMQGMLNGQTLGTAAWLKAMRARDFEAAIDFVERGTSKFNLAMVVAQKMADAQNDIDNGVPSGIAITGAAINGTLIAGSGAFGTALGGPVTGVFVGGAVDLALPSDEKMGHAAVTSLEKSKAGKMMWPGL